MVAVKMAVWAATNPATQGCTVKTVVWAAAAVVAGYGAAWAAMVVLAVGAAAQAIALLRIAAATAVLAAAGAATIPVTMAVVGAAAQDWAAPF